MGYIDELKNSDDPQDQTRLENLIELVSVAQEFVAAAHAIAGTPETTMAVRFADGRTGTLDVSQARHTIITGDN